MAEFNAALDLMRRLPPRDVEKNLNHALNLAPSLVDDLLSAVDQPLKAMRCPESNKDFVLCDYNRDGDSFRSPWSNKYSPPLDDGACGEGLHWQDWSTAVRDIRVNQGLCLRMSCDGWRSRPMMRSTNTENSTTRVACLRVIFGTTKVRGAWVCVACVCDVLSVFPSSDPRPQVVTR